MSASRTGRAAALALLLAALPSLAAVAGLDPGTQVGATQTTATSVTGTKTISAGSNRLLLVTVYVRKSASDATFSVTTATYGTRPLTQVQATTATSRIKVYVGYLNETDIAAATGNTINVTIAAGTTTEWAVFAQTYSGVDPAAPITASRQNFNDTNTTTSATFGANNAVNAGGYTVYALATQGTNTRTLPTGYAQDWTLSTANASAWSDDKAAVAAGNENPTIAYTPGQRYALVALSLNPLVVVNNTAAGTIAATQTSCTGFTVSAPYTGDQNGNNSLTYRFRTPSGGTYGASTPVVHAASPYSIPFTGLTPFSTYDVEVTYADADGVSGTAIQTLTNVVVGANCTGVGATSATVDTCNQITATATFTNNANADGSTLFERSPNGLTGWTTVAGCAAVTGMSPSVCTDTSALESSTYYYRATFTDPDGTVGTNPTAVAGPYGTPACPLKSNARIVFSNNTTTPQDSLYTASTNTFSAAAPTVAGVTQRWIVLRAAPTRSEFLAGYVTNTGVLYVLRWNGTAWSAEWNVTVGGNGVDGRRFDIAYENTSGRALVVYSNNTTGVDELRYRIWDGATWTAATNLDSARLTATPTAIKLAARPGASNEVAMTACDNGTTAGNTADLTTMIWNGTAWGNEPATAHATTIPSTTGQLVQNDLFDMAYETASGDLFVIFTTSAPQQNHRTYSAGTWGAVTSWGTARAAPLQMVAVANPDPASNQILCLFNRSASATIYARAWDGAALGTTVTVGTTGINPTAIEQRTLEGAWLKSGASTVAIAFWTTAAAGSIGYNTSTNGGTTWGTATTFATAIGSPVWFDAAMDPLVSSTMMLTLSDSAGDLFGRTVSWNGAALTWTTPAGGTLTTTLASTTSQNFAFAYERFTGGPWTTAGAIAAVPSGCNGLSVTAAYTDDLNTNNTLSYRYAPAGTGTWSAPIALGHSASPYSFTIAGLTTGSAYDVEVTFVDGDTVVGTNPQTVTNVAVGGSCTVAGTVTVGQTSGATPSLLITAPYTVDGNANNTGSYRTRTPSGTGAWTAAAPVAHSASPYQVTLSGLTCGASYDVEWTFLDADGIGGGTAVQTVSSVSPTNCTTTGGPGGVINSCTSITVNAPFTFDGNANGSAAFESGPSASGPWTPVAGCGVVTGPSPRSCLDGTVAASSTTYYRVTFSDADGVSGTNPAVSGALTTPTCSNPPVIPGVPTVAATSCSSLAVSAPFTGDTNTNSTTTVSYGPTAAGPWTVACSGLSGASPRSCTVPGLANASAWHVQVVFTDPDGVTGSATQVVGPTSTLDCRVAPGTASATANSCSQITASATHTGDSNGTSTSAFARGPSSSGPWTTVCASVGGASPRQCVDLGVTALSTWWYRVTYTDPDTVNGANPIVTATSVTTPTCWDVLTLSSGTGQPPAANVLQGSTGTVVAKLLLSASSSGSLTVSSLALTNLGTAVAGADVQGLLLWDDANANGAADVGEALLGSASYTSGQYVFSGLSHVVTAPTNRQLLVTLNVAAGATAARTFRFQVDQAGVVVVAPDTVSATNLPLAGSVFTVTAGTWTEGDPTAGSVRPVAVILNPSNGATVSSDGPAGTTGFRVQAQIASPSALTSVTLSTDNGVSYGTTLTQNANYGGTATEGVWETTVKLNPGAYVLRVRATNAAGAVDTGKVQIVVNAKGIGDGNLLVRDNSSQLCLDCHALQTHSSQSTGNKYGSWAVSCRDCHAPHGTTNIYLVRNQIVPPAVNGPQAAKTVKFSTTTGANASTLATAQSFVNESDHSGPCQVCHTRTQGAGGVARWRNTGNADTHYTSAAGTAPCTDCHPHAGGFKPMSCLGCHGTTGAETTDLGDTFWSNGIKTTFNTDEWTWSGHGKTTGTYDVTGNPAANFSTAPSPGASECLYCHDDSVSHKTATNPFRLRGASNVSGVTAAYSTASPNDTCLNCHNTGSNGVTPGGQTAKNGTIKTDTAHDGAKHTAGSLGGKFCWDCHDPHGDRTSLGLGNITMVRNSVLAVTDGTYGYLGLTGQARAVSYTSRNATPPAQGKTVETTTAAGTQHVGLCQACHGDTSETNWTKYWNRQGYDDPNGPPNTDRIASAHNSGSATVPYCVSCHPHAQKFKGTGACTDCHASPQPITMGPLAGTRDRRAIVPEFNNAWSHKRSATPAGTVTKWDCVVCHMEGDATTGDPSAVHANGYLDLRDPDTGTTIEGVTFGGTGAGAYASTAGVTATPAQFSRDLGSATIEPDMAAIMVNQCLKCHDNNGALSTSARVPTTGTAEKPFGTTIAGAAYTGAGVTANGVLGGVTDVNESFKTTNSSYHPVSGKQNNWYAKLTRMKAPWNAATRGATVDATSWGPLLSCWDCHAPVGATGVQTASVTAHGAAATLRGTPAVSGLPAATTNQVTLCIVCHNGYDTCGVAGNCTTLPSHGPDSALSVKTNGGMVPYLPYGCNMCHSSNYAPATITGTQAAVVRPIRAQDVHGVNALPTTGLAKSVRWAGTSTGTPAQVDAKPYAFIRNTSVLSDSTPAKIGASTYSANCNMAQNPCNQGMKTYTVGGTY